jgi:hypothetical protein
VISAITTYEDSDQIVAKLQIALFPYKDLIYDLANKMTDEDYFESRDRFADELNKDKEAKELFKKNGFDYVFTTKDEGERS